MVGGISEESTREAQDMGEVASAERTEQTLKRRLVHHLAHHVLPRHTLPGGLGSHQEANCLQQKEVQSRTQDTTLLFTET